LQKGREKVRKVRKVRKDYYGQVKEAADALRGRIGVGEVPSIGIVLGSGLGGFAGSLQPAVSIRYEELPHWPISRVAGHDGRAVVGMLSGHLVIILAGRCHVYEGHSLEAVTFAVRALGLLGVKVLILTNAAGGIDRGLIRGTMMVIDDHVNLMGCNPLAGPNDDRFGPRFPDMSQVYSWRLRRMADTAAERAGLPLAHGTYAAMAGPSYETPAEIRYLQTIGVDAVGMSTVPEALVARHMGIELLGLSCISNMAAGVLPQPLDHTEVVETTRRSLTVFSSLLEGIIGQL
jgi:purine-nucleoside phosphorylase